MSIKYENLFLGISSIILSMFLFQNVLGQSNNFTNTNTTIAINAEDFKDCFLDLKASSSSFAFGSGLNYLIMMLCYETYKGEGKFNQQLSKDQIANINQEIKELKKSSDLEKNIECISVMK